PSWRNAPAAQPFSASVRFTALKRCFQRSLTGPARLFETQSYIRTGRRRIYCFTAGAYGGMQVQRPRWETDKTEDNYENRSNRGLRVYRVKVGTQVGRSRPRSHRSIPKFWG